MPTEEENVQYLYLVLTHGGVPTIDWDKVSEDLNLKKGATTKRWSRLRAAMTEGKNPGPSAMTFLWLLVKHSSRDKVMDWNEIAEKCDTTAGAASKRWSRLKQSIENGDGPPATPAKNKVDGEKKSAKKRTPKKAAKDEADDDGIKNEDDDEGEEEKPKSKKASPKKRTPKKAIKADADTEGGIDDEETSKNTPAKGKRGRNTSDGDVDDEESPTKRSRPSTKATTIKKEEPSASPDEVIDTVSGIQDVIIKHEPTATDGEDDGGDTFHEANEQIRMDMGKIAKHDPVDADDETEIIV